MTTILRARGCKEALLVHSRVEKEQDRGTKSGRNGYKRTRKEEEEEEEEGADE